MFPRRATFSAFSLLLGASALAAVDRMPESGERPRRAAPVPTAIRPANPDKKRQRKAERKARRSNRGRR